MLVSGTSLYNELMRSCLPRMYDSLADSDVEARPSLPSAILLPSSFFTLVCSHKTARQAWHFFPER